MAKGFSAYLGVALVCALTGCEGATGAQGKPGTPGMDGIDGVNGLDGQQGEQGAQGPAGPAGMDGQQGPQGAQGPQGLPGDDGTDAVLPDGGYAETDPTFASSAAAAITSDQIAQWDDAYSHGSHADAGYLTEEADPVFAASAAAAVTSGQVANWEAAHGWGNHGTAGYLKTEADPLFAASAAATVTSARVSNWESAFSWGNHGTAGYLKTEADPTFAASAAAGVTSAKIANWDAAYARGDHASAGYLTEEEDPTIGNLTNGKLPKWNGTNLVDSVVTESSGKLGVSNASPDGLLSVGSVVSLGKDVVAESKSCATNAGSDWTNTPPSGGACTTYCTGSGYSTGVVSASGTKFCGGSPICAYVSDFGTCATATHSNNGNCDTCATTFTCTCLNVVSVFDKEVQVDNYLRVASTTGAPAARHCDAASERGRVKMDPATGTLYVCANSGWVAK